MLFTTLASYPLLILLSGGHLVLPRSLDPSPLLCPIVFPIMVALSMTQESTRRKNPYVVSNIILSLSSLPPTSYTEVGSSLDTVPTPPRHPDAFPPAAKLRI